MNTLRWRTTVLRNMGLKAPLALALLCSMACTPLKPGTDSVDSGTADAGSCSEVFTSSFETGIAEWTIWANCPTDDTWSVEQSDHAAPAGGAHGLHLHSGGFEQRPCDYPGVYALSPAIPAEVGATYQVESMSRNGETIGTTVLLFHDTFALGKVQLSQDLMFWSKDSGEYDADPILTGTAPPGTICLRVRYGLHTPYQAADVDLLRVTRLDGRCSNSSSHP